MPGPEDPADIFNILVASDIHLGYNESDQIRGDDSFVTFEEILSYAVEHDVDFILLGGDLFHDAKPSPNCLLRCASLLRKYCFGSKPVAIEILSDQSENFKESASRKVNYEDPNINVSYPLFSIHGNHDDPIGRSAISSLDILARIGLVNYIGKWTNYSDVTVSPVLMKKGKTKIALYGLSYLKDQRLARLFANGNVKIEKVDSDQEWFNILTLHQNRADRGYLNYIPEDVLPGFMDLIIWGHEHDCRIKEEWNPTKSFHVIQPGSPVATSLAAGESLPKHCGILKVYEKGFKMFPIKLQTVRPFIFETVVLSEVLPGHQAVDEHEIVQDYLKDRVEEAISKSVNERSGHPDQPKLPLVRLNVFYERESQQFNVIRFGQQFSERIANPQDLILLKREKAKERNVVKTDLDMEALGDLVSEVDADEISVESLLEQYYRDQPDDKKLSMLSVKCLGEAVKNFTQKGCTDAFSDVIRLQKDEYMKHLIKSDVEAVDEIRNQIFLCKELHFSENSTETNKINKMLENSGPKAGQSYRDEQLSSDGDDNPSVDVENNSAKNSRGRGRGRGRGSTVKSSKATVSTPARGRGSRGGRGSRARGKSPSNGAASLNVSYETLPQSNNWLTNYSQQMSSRQTTRTKKTNAIYIDDSDE